MNTLSQCLSRVRGELMQKLWLVPPSLAYRYKFSMGRDKSENGIRMNFGFLFISLWMYHLKV